MVPKWRLEELIHGLAETESETLGNSDPSALLHGRLHTQPPCSASGRCVVRWLHCFSAAAPPSRPPETIDIPSAFPNIGLLGMQDIVLGLVLQPKLIFDPHLQLYSICKGAL